MYSTPLTVLEKERIRYNPQLFRALINMKNYIQHLDKSQTNFDEKYELIDSFIRRGSGLY
jgi:hypothetical protein